MRSGTKKTPVGGLGLHDGVLPLQTLLVIPSPLLGKASGVPKDLGYVLNPFDVINDKRQVGIRDAAEGFYQIDQVTDLRWVAWGIKQGELIEEDRLRPLSKAVLHKGLRVFVTIVGENHIGMSVVRWPVDILSCRELDLMPHLPLEVGEEIVIEAAILRGHDRGEANEGSWCSGRGGWRTLGLAAGAQATGRQCLPAATAPAAPPKSCRKQRRLTTPAVNVAAKSVVSPRGNTSVIIRPFLNVLDRGLTSVSQLLWITKHVTEYTLGTRE